MTSLSKFLLVLKHLWSSCHKAYWLVSETVYWALYTHTHTVIYWICFPFSWNPNIFGSILCIHQTSLHERKETVIMKRRTSSENRLDFRRKPSWPLLKYVKQFHIFCILKQNFQEAILKHDYNHLQNIQNLFWLYHCSSLEAEFQLMHNLEKIKSK